MTATADVYAPGLVIRPLEPSDGALLRGLFERLSPESRYFRFMSPVQYPEQTRPDRLLDVDHREREALAVLVGGELEAVARYAVTEPGAAEIAVVVADAWQHSGLASMLLYCLAQLARTRGIDGFVGHALGENRRVVALIRKVFPDSRVSFEDGLVRMEIPLRA